MHLPPPHSAVYSEEVSLCRSTLLVPHSASQPLAAMAISRREPGPHDVQMAIDYCGVCHSDLHQARSEWAGTVYPCVPGHEIVGRVTAVGDHVTRYVVGDLVGVGCMVDSCQQCEECEEGLENYCDQMVLTYNGPTQDAPGHTLGGYSQQIVVHERYVLRVRHPQEQLAAVAPLPLRRYHHLLAACATGTSARVKSGHRRHRRAGTHGDQVGPRHGRSRGGLYHLGIQA
ncbi:Uncharacterized zinc-type alcohol dehydrogenase-like protein YahK [Raoultella terrigena]|uniref:Uncharacterized zinc-type alcohol dehydrogenase-like protein YahK n=1 Tax=Raoultella terrigena TaxID=577 RepID=A0A4U9D4E7_RAOTE|nr:Uncharacterized zinc-type alcohol dehydrogenase-like protein YahK [Raoultella terrigena]